MGLYGFQNQFVPLVLNGSKIQTIRAQRKRLDKPGDTMHLYRGLRTKDPALLLRAPCTNVEPILIDTAGVQVNGVLLDSYERDLLAWRDGFRSKSGRRLGSFSLMMEFWRKHHDLPFAGHIYHWDFGRALFK